jgi:formate C-acetyltransferase
MLVDGCIDSGRDVTAGGAVYNGSGIQGVGIADTADCLAALEEVVFRKKQYDVNQVRKALRGNFDHDPKLRTALLNAPKFGNDHPLPDGYAAMVAKAFADSLGKHRNTRGGAYVAGFYSSTSHVGFGERTGALPSGRRGGEPFAASLGAANGRDGLGPTALLKSVARIDPTLAPNGYATNLRFDRQVLEGEKGVDVLRGLVQGFFDSGGMEVQFNIVDPHVLEDARSHPGKYPELVVRVAGYCAYFDDLPDPAKQEIISRTRLQVS